jgi:hypothetical protein
MRETIMSSRKNSASVRSTSEGNGLDRRHFLKDVAAVGGAAANNSSGLARSRAIAWNSRSPFPPTQGMK